MYRDQLFTDLKLFVGQNRKEYKVHRLVLSKSEFIQRACLGQFQEAQTQEINLPEMSEASIDIIIGYCYGGHWELEEAILKMKPHPKNVGKLCEDTTFLCLESLRKQILQDFTSLLKSDFFTSQRIFPKTLETHMACCLKAMYELTRESEQEQREIFVKTFLEYWNVADATTSKYLLHQSAAGENFEMEIVNEIFQYYDRKKASSQRGHKKGLQG